MPTRQFHEVLQHLRRAGGLPDRESLTDGQLLEHFVRHREEGAFTALVRWHGPMVWGVCLRVLRDHHHAEDAFQATFLVLVRRAASIWPREAVGNWLYGVAYQTALKARATAARRQARERQVTVMPEPEAPDRDLWHDLRPLLDRELSRLPAKYRIPLVLCDLEGRPRKEVARQLGWPEGTLSGRLARARQALARRLTQRGVTVTGTTLATVLAKDAASASVPLAVVSSTIQTAILDATGQAVTAGAIPASVAALMKGVLKDMLLTKLTISAVVLVAMGLLVLGGGLLTLPTAEGQYVIPSNGEAAPPKQTAATPKTDKEKLQGVWKVVSYGFGDKPSKGEEILFLVNGNRACWQTKDGGLEGGLYLDPSAHPKAYDLATSEKTIEGIYDLDGDTLRLCYNLAEEAPRPRQFATQPGNRQVLLVLKRQKEFGTDLNCRRPDGSKVLFPSLVERVETGPPPPAPRNLDALTPPAEGREITGLREQVKSLERRVAALEAKLKPAPGARNKQPTRVGQIIIVGNKKTPDSAIRNKLELYPGQVLDFQALRAAEKRLAEFNATVAVVEDGGDSVYRDILVTVKEK
jgi:RNA polymerase sigma factor (sigma-70 family)